MRRYLLHRQWNLDEHWDDTNCILHGAMSITGLAIVTSDAAPEGWAVATWLWVVVVLVLVEGIEAARLVSRVRSYGLRDGVFNYYVSQWARIFTFGMFYAFSLQLYRESIAPAWASEVLRMIVVYGHYVVLAALLAQTALFLLDRVTLDSNGKSATSS